MAVSDPDFIVNGGWGGGGLNKGEMGPWGLIVLQDKGGPHPLDLPRCIDIDLSNIDIDLSEMDIDIDFNVDLPILIFICLILMLNCLILINAVSPKQQNLNLHLTFLNC